MRILIFALLISLRATFTSAEEVDVEFDGSSSVSSDSSSDGRHVTVHNAYNRSVSLFWGSNTVEEAFMFDMKSNGNAEMSSYDGHSFFATEIGYTNKVLGAFIIRNDADYYVIRGSEAKGAISRDSPVIIMGRRSSSLTAKFRCLCAAVDYYFDDGADGSLQGSLLLGREVSTNTYEGHVFYFTEKDNKSNEIARFVMSNEKALYLVIDAKNPPPPSYLEHAALEEKYRNDYFNRTGLVWRHFFGPEGPRPIPVLHMWETPFVGHKHLINSSHGFWNCAGSPATCHSKEPVLLELEVASTAPKVFVIPSFLSDFECSEIINLARPNVANSLIGDLSGGGASVSSTRTSKNSWISRDKSLITETLSLRAADLMNIDEKLLHTNSNSEDLQVVHYTGGQKYDPHNDWGGAGKSESRFLTLLLYLNDMDGPDAGGETAFPKGAGGLGFKVTPRKGSAVLFYNLLEDGNGDDLALHAALPVVRGEKWAANFWVWDPKR